MAYSEEYLLDVLRQAHQKFGRMPTRRELAADKEFGLHDKAFRRVFGSWDEAKNRLLGQFAAEKPELEIDTILLEDDLYNDIIVAQQAQKELDLALEPYRKGVQPVLALSDIELPYANLKQINEAVKDALALGAKIVVLNGDITHSDFFSKHAKSAHVPPKEEYKQLEQLIAFLSSKFEQVILVRGNHDEMVSRYMHRELPAEQLNFLIKSDLLDSVASHYMNVHYAHNFWARVFDAVYAHPYNYSTVPMRTCINIATSIKRWTEFRAIIIGHTHKVGALVMDEDEAYYEMGCACLLQPYTFKSMHKTKWVNAYNIAHFIDGKIDLNLTRNVIWQP